MQQGMCDPVHVGTLCWVWQPLGPHCKDRTVQDSQSKLALPRQLTGQVLYNQDSEFLSKMLVLRGLQEIQIKVTLL